MSMMYKNNLTNSSLYKLGRVPSPLCSLCEREEETADHLLFRCTEVEEELRRDVATTFRQANNLNERDDIETDFISILNCSRNKEFIKSCIHVLSSINIRVSIVL